MAGVRRWHLEKESVHDEHIPASEISLGKLKAGDIQYGKTSVTFPFAVAGEENVSASISFPTAFDAAPAVIASVEGINVGIVSIVATATGFTITVRDDKGTDYTTAQTATVRWIAIKI